MAALQPDRPARAAVTAATTPGPVGYIDAGGDGTWMVGIRSMTVREDRRVLAAGVGIVERLRPGAELIETNLKLTAVFDALAPGLPFSTGGDPAPARGGGLSSPRPGRCPGPRLGRGRSARRITAARASRVVPGDEVAGAGHQGQLVPRGWRGPG